MFGFLFLVFPAIIIHIQYYINDKDKIILIANDRNTIIYGLKNSNQKEISFDDVKEVFITKRQMKLDLGIEWLAWHEYEYFTFVINNGDVFIISNLTIRKEEIPFDLTLINKPIPFIGKKDRLKK